LKDTKGTKEIKGMIEEERVGKLVLGCAMRVHSQLGPGLLESAYEACLFYELVKERLSVKRQLKMPVRYGELEIEAGYRLDLLINECVVIELKAVESCKPLHFAQLLSYLRLGGYRLGYLLNFNVEHMRNGIKRIVN